MSAPCVPSVESTTSYWESQVLLAVTLWLSGVVVDRTFTSVGVDVRVSSLCKCLCSLVKFSWLVSTAKLF